MKTTETTTETTENLAEALTAARILMDSSSWTQAALAALAAGKISLALRAWDLARELAAEGK